MSETFYFHLTIIKFKCTVTELYTANTQLNIPMEFICYHKIVKMKKIYKSVTDIQENNNFQQVK